MTIRFAIFDQLLSLPDDAVGEVLGESSFKEVSSAAANLWPGLGTGIARKALHVLQERKQFDGS